MTPQEIIAEAQSRGVLLYLQDGNLSFIGTLPKDWAKTTTAWLPYKAAVVEWLKDPPWEHRAAVARAQADQARRRNQPCINLGTLVDPKPACGCGPLYTCKVHGHCVLYGNTNQWVACSRCQDYRVGE